MDVKVLFYIDIYITKRKTLSVSHGKIRDYMKSLFHFKLFKLKNFSMRFNSMGQKVKPSNGIL